MLDILIETEYNYTMTQKELAKKLGITRSYLNSILRGKRRPGIKLAKKIAATQGVSFFTYRPDLKEMLKEALS